MTIEDCIIQWRHREPVAGGETEMVLHRRGGCGLLLRGWGRFVFV